MTYFTFGTIAGDIVRYSNDYYDAYFDNVKNVTVSGLIKKNIQTGSDGYVAEYISSGMNSPATVTITVECYPSKIGEIAKSFIDTQFKYDTGGTLDIIEPSGALWTFYDAVLQQCPFEKSVESTAETASYELIFQCPQPDSPSTA
jgi:hypothetical protein